MNAKPTIPMAGLNYFLLQLKDCMMDTSMLLAGWKVHEAQVWE